MPKLSPGALSLLSSALYLLANHGLTIALRLVYVVFLARELGPAQYGTFSYALSWYLLFMPLTSLGQGLILAREIAANRESAAEIATSTLSLRLFVSALVCLTCLFSGWLVNAGRDELTLVLLFGLAIVPRALAQWGRVMFIAFERSKDVLTIDTVFRILEVFIGILLLLSNAELYILVLNHLFIWSCQAMLSMLLVRWRYTPFHLTVRIRRAKALLQQGISLSLTHLADNWTVSGPVVLFRQLSDDVEALGRLALCTQVLGYLRVIPSAVGTAALPALRRAMMKENRNQQRFANAYLVLVLAQSVVLALLAELFGADILSTTVGPAYTGVAGLLAPIAWISAAFAIAMLATYLSALANRTRAPLIGSLLGVTTMLLLTPVLTTMMGFDGALLAAIVGIGIAALWTTWRLSATVDHLLPTTVGALIASMASYLGPHGPDPGWPASGLFTSLSLVVLTLLVSTLLPGKSNRRRHQR